MRFWTRNAVAAGEPTVVRVRKLRVVVPGEPTVVRVRTVSTVVAGALAAAVAVSGLTACETKVGVAAIVAGHRISESQVAKYLTTKAAAVSVRTQTGAAASVSPRAYVLNTLIDERLYDRLLSSAGRPSEGDIARATEQALRGLSAQRATEQSGIRGFAVAFDRLWIRVQILRQTLLNAVQKGVDVRALIDKLNFPVTVNPRYGVWDKKLLGLSAAAGAGIPDYLKLDGSSPASTAPAAAPSN